MNDEKKTYSATQKTFDVFLPGETIDLCVPSDQPWVLDQWYRWFNRPEITKYLAQGVFPNTRHGQKRYFDDLVDNESRIVLLIKPKNEDHFIGVASLSSIDRAMRQCDFAMVIGERDGGSNSLFYGMEAKCLMTEHAFEALGVERVNSTQATELLKWQRWQILFGYQIEGLLRKKFRKGRNVYDVFSSSCLFEDYLLIKDRRGGKFWPGKSAMFELLKRLPKDTLIDELMTLLPQKQKKFFDSVTFSLEHNLK
jgi:RimJ/RimL family protein N-acetyltransferase